MKDSTRRRRERRQGQYYTDSAERAMGRTRREVGESSGKDSVGSKNEQWEGLHGKWERAVGRTPREVGESNGEDSTGSGREQWEGLHGK